MQALLRYGQFTALIQVPGNEPQDIVAIMKPSEEVSLIPLQDYEFGEHSAATGKTTRLEFRLKDRLSNDLWLYDFWTEA